MIETLELRGRHLIEASAGTGKTYTLCLLVLRLVLEDDLDLRRLAVVTFTKAAASELADRIGSTLRRARRPEGTSPDPQVDALLAKATATLGAAEVALRLERAETDLDLARISTIHGFCSRLLGEFAFELKAGLGWEHLEDETPLLLEVLQDFWRSELQNLPLELQPKVSQLPPEALLKQLKSLMSFPGLPVRGPTFTLAGVQAAAEAWHELGRVWQQEGTEFARAFAEQAAKFNQSSYRVDRVPGYLEDLALALQGEEPDFAVLQRFRATALTAKLKAGQNFLLPRFASLLDDWAEAYLLPTQRLSPALITQAWRFLQDELPRRKAELRQRSSNDLVEHVVQGLRRSPSAVLAIRRRFQTVLVDEFQDTDPLQDELFQTLFPGEGPLLVMVGDPKQAVYAFRGGDLSTYLAARERLAPTQIHELATNFRSQARLLEALNEIYARAGKRLPQGPFLNADIGYTAVAAGKLELLPWILDGRRLPPVTLWQAPVGAQPKPRDVARRVAAEIFRLQAAGLCQLRDCAVLISANKSARILKAELARWGLPSVTGKSGSVLESPEAEQLEHLLAVLVHPRDLGLVSALLLGPLFGWDDQRLSAWKADEREVEATLARFQELQALWSRTSLARVLDEFLLERNLLLPPAADGAQNLLHQRRVTNFRHLGELLHAQDQRTGRQRERVARWFTELRAQGGDEYEERLEGDEGAVNLVTMHKSKGLQWPVVFAVDLIKEAKFSKDKTSPVYRDDQGKRYADFDPAQAAGHKDALVAEAHQERQRLAYVALTRAEQLLYVVTGGKAGPKSAAHLLFEGLEAEADNPEPLIAVAPLLGVAPVPPPPPLPREVRPLSVWKQATPRAAWTVGSYSGLVRDLPHAETPVASGVAPPGSLFAFPRGAQAGTALHSLFEKLDYKRPTGNPELTEAETRRVAKLLLAGGISGGEAAAAAVKLVQTVLAHPLLPDVPAFSLGQLGRRQRAVEVKFHLSVGSGPALTDARLAEALGARVGRIAPQVSLSGYLYGLIDLVFQCPEDHKWYIVDWKSNHLGNRFEDYGPDALQAAMEANHYLLQAHLYTVAWCRHLRLLDPKFNYEQQFGGVAYVFLRGLQPRERTGIWFHKPAWDVVETLGGLL